MKNLGPNMKNECFIYFDEKMWYRRKTHTDIITFTRNLKEKKQ